ncbi:proline iminopeptidase [Kribbella sp. VKM Ac-2571]|uniref:prolyl aminopeptidase n=1 Tax=Kribbella sp. VKM Ac-2571 TaxID=2512222 RepID=UPI0010605C56|nr:prolyl aminopeptidase [Kribbella sp. VKM Ac-2571]TDO67506.1 proline iminopeptidase [Kribbella sp. VKM Ac-2571]
MYPDIEPYDHGLLDVGDGHRVYWETCGNPAGKPALVVHGGPGSGAGAWWRRYFDPTRYRVVLVDQRNCGRSTPDAAEPTVDLSTNTTAHLIADFELLRRHLGISRWLILGASWGATLGLAYAEQHPDAISEIVLFSVTNTSRREVAWLTRDMGRIFPEEWERFRDGVPEDQRDGNLALAYSRLLHDPDPAVREKAACDWCGWEDTHVRTHPGWRPDPRFDDPVFRLRFARLVTHYWAHAAWLEEDVLVREAGKLAGIPGVLIHGKLDISGPPDIAWRMAQAWPGAELHLVERKGHGAGGSGTQDLILGALDRFALRA